MFSGMQWRSIGPYRGSRAVAAAGVPGNNNTFYFGAVDGGVWKTTNAGLTWIPMFDDQPVASIGALAVAPSNPQIIYAGTGESDIRSDLASGEGVYKSADSGKTWKNVGLRETRQISRIVIDPKNPDVVYVGALGHAYGPNAERGVYKSTDGGKTWTHSLDQGPEVGVSDLAIAAAGPQVLFAGAWQAHRPPSFFELYVTQGHLLPNPGLKPERALYADAAAAFLHALGLLQVGGFYAIYEDLISYEYYPPMLARPMSL